jgi:solute carrier family 25 phosphate transporter 3
MGGDAPAGAPKVKRDIFFYGKCSIGGILSCGLTHAATVSLDLHKCRSQAHAGVWPGSLGQGLKQIIQNEGYAGLKIGWTPTLFGYGAQGMFKFGLNEAFQDFYKGLVGEENVNTKVKKILLQAAASGSAEIFADVALCPFEMTKVKMQVQLPGPTPGPVPMSLIPAMQWMSANKADTRFPFGSLKPLWGRQIPYTIIKFVVFYQTAEFVYEQIEKKQGMKKADVPAGVQLAITFGCGYWAGIFCAVTTQPMDNLVSMAGSAKNKGKTFGQIASEAGMKTLFTKGLGTRILMVGTLTGLQWWIYGAFKNAMGFGTY